MSSQGFAKHKDNINLTGRKKGTQNIVTTETKALFKLILENNMQRFQEDLDQLHPKDRINALLHLAGFFIPKLKSVDITVETQSKFKPIEVTIIDSEEFKEISNQLEQKY
jgi:hypothetical protein